MDNWLLFVLGLVLGIPLSISANIATPWVKSYFEKRSLSRRERRLYIIVQRYKSIKKMNENPAFQNSLLFGGLATALIFVVFLIGFIGIGLIGIILFKKEILSIFFNFYVYVLLIYMVIAISMLNLIRNDALAAISFEEYKKKTIAKLIKLGGNPEELDKIDKEIETEN